jgi:hypothetical protein
MEGKTMEGLMTVSDLIELLQQCDLDAHVFSAVVKYPQEFKIEFKDGEPRWMDHSDVECQPLTFDDVIEYPEKIVYLAVELEEFNADRWMLNGNRAD